MHDVDGTAVAANGSCCVSDAAGISSPPSSSSPLSYTVLSPLWRLFCGISGPAGASVRVSVKGFSGVRSSARDTWTAAMKRLRSSSGMRVCLARSTGCCVRRSVVDRDCCSMMGSSEANGPAGKDGRILRRSVIDVGDAASAMYTAAS